MKEKNLTYIILGIFLLLVGAVFFADFLAVTNSNGEYIQVPTFKWFSCEPASEVVSSPTVSLSNGATYTCPDNSNGCEVWVVGESNTFISRRFKYQICDKGGSNCYAESYSEVNDYWSLFSRDTSKPTKLLTTLTKAQEVKITYQRETLPLIWFNQEGASLYYNYAPYVLWSNSFFSGRNEYTTVEQGCVFPSNVRSNLINSVTNLIGIQIKEQTSTDNYQLQPEKTINFIDQFIPISVENVNFVTYNGQAGYCISSKDGRNVYSIGEVKTNSGTYKIVNTNYNAIIGSNLACCPGESEPTRTCNSNFQWVNIVGSQCSEFKACSGIDWMPSTTKFTQVQYYCDAGLCKSRTRTVECNTNEDCVGNSNGAYCDTKIWKCSKIAGPVGTKGNGTTTSSSCKTCDEFAKSQLFGWIDNTGLFKDKTYQCEASGSSLFPPKLAQSNSTCVFSFIKYILTIFAVIFAFILSLGFFQSYKSTRKNPILIYALTLGVTIGVGLASYYLWWLGVLLLLSIFIIKNYIKTTPLGFFTR